MIDSPSDYHAVLGLDKTASPAMVRAAFRRLAKRCHPDAPGGDAVQFAALAEARAALCARAGAKPGARRNLVSRFWRLAKTPPSVPERGEDVHLVLRLSLEDALAGALRRVSTPAGRALEVRCPPGCADGDVIRLRGVGAPGRHGGPCGDVLVRIALLVHRFACVHGRDIHFTHWLDLRRLRAGGKIAVLTPRGPLNVCVPPLSRTGQVLRLKGLGLPGRGRGADGHMFITLNARRSPGFADALARFARIWTNPLRPVA